MLDHANLMMFRRYQVQDEPGIGRITTSNRHTIHADKTCVRLDPDLQFLKSAFFRATCSTSSPPADDRKYRFVA